MGTDIVAASTGRGAHRYGPVADHQPGRHQGPVVGADRRGTGADGPGCGDARDGGPRRPVGPRIRPAAGPGTGAARAAAAAAAFRRAVASRAWSITILAVYAAAIILSLIAGGGAR